MAVKCSSTYINANLKLIAIVSIGDGCKWQSSWYGRQEINAFFLHSLLFHIFRLRILENCWNQCILILTSKLLHLFCFYLLNWRMKSYVAFSIWWCFDSKRKVKKGLHWCWSLHKENLIQNIGYQHEKDLM